MTFSVLYFIIKENVQKFRQILEIRDELYTKTSGAGNRGNDEYFRAKSFSPLKQIFHH